MEDLASKLSDIFQTKSDKTMFVKAGGKIPYGKVVEAMDVARGAGVERIGIISESMTPPRSAAASGAPRRGRSSRRAPLGSLLAIGLGGRTRGGPSRAAGHPHAIEDDGRGPAGPSRRGSRV